MPQSSDAALSIGKLDAARRQAETAIRLFFSYGDPVSIHTLSAAAYNIVRDVNKKRGGPPLFMKERCLEYAKPGHEDEIRRRFNAAENFFKHADRDHDASFEFHPGFSELLLLETCGTYFKLTGDFPVLFKLFQTWYVLHNPDHFEFSAHEQELLRVTALDAVSLGREEFHRVLLPALSRIGA